MQDAPHHVFTRFTYAKVDNPSGYFGSSPRSLMSCTELGGCQYKCEYCGFNMVRAPFNDQHNIAIRFNSDECLEEIVKSESTPFRCRLSHHLWLHGRCYDMISAHEGFSFRAISIKMEAEDVEEITREFFPLAEFSYAPRQEGDQIWMLAKAPAYYGAGSVDGTYQLKAEPFTVVKPAAKTKSARNIQVSVESPIPNVTQEPGCVLDC